MTPEKEGWKERGHDWAASGSFLTAQSQQLAVTQPPPTDANEPNGWGGGILVQIPPLPSGKLGNLSAPVSLRVKWGLLRHDD